MPEVIPFPKARLPLPDPLFGRPRSRVIVDAIQVAWAINAGADTPPFTDRDKHIRVAALSLLEADRLDERSEAQR